MEFVQYEVTDRIAYITLNRPEKRNALNHQFVQELKDCFQQAAEDEAVKVIVLRSASVVFSAGADLEYLKTLQNNTFDENLADSDHLKALFHQMYRHPKVIIAQIEGHAIAGGCGLATVCDFSFTVPEAKFGYTEVKIGFVPAIVMFFLLRKIGEGKAKELLLTGKLIEASEAAALGLINQLVPADRIQEAVRDFAKQLCVEASGDSLQLTKAMIADIQELSMEQALNYASEQNARARASSDCQNGIQNFLAKKPNQW
jgi:methylglutaconyl-CoA hydratase